MTEARRPSFLVNGYSLFPTNSQLRAQVEDAQRWQDDGTNVGTSNLFWVCALATAAFSESWASVARERPREFEFPTFVSV